MTIHLIDYLAYIMNCSISELKNTVGARLLYNISKIPAESCSPGEWTQCSDYLFPLEHSCKTPTASDSAKSDLMEAIRQHM